MRMTFITSSVVCLMLATAADAQRFGGERQGPPTPEEIRDLMVLELNMDDVQAADLDAIFDSHADALAEGREAMEAARSLRGEMRSAREAGDEEEMDRLRGEMRASFEVGRNAMRAYMDDVETILSDEQREKLGEILPGPGRRGGRGERGRRDGRSPVERFNDALSTVDMTADQEAAIDTLIDEMTPEFQARREQWEAMRPLFEEMRTAREEGDSERVDELRAQIREQRPERGDLMRRFVGGLEEILSPEQMEQLRAAGGMGRGRGEGRGRGGREAQPQGDMRMILRVLRDLDLTPEQRDDIRHAMEETRRAAQAEREDSRQEHFDALIAAVKSVLTDEQAVQFDAELAELQERQGDRGRRGNREGRQRRDGPRGEDGDRGPRRGGPRDRGADNEA